MDDTAGSDVRYNVYEKQGGGIHPLLEWNNFTIMHLCSGSYFFERGEPPKPMAGAWVVKAVDWAGNEDDNNVILQVENLCESTGPSCQFGPRPVAPHAGFFMVLSAFLLVRWRRQRRC